jgi:hypothetical protein
MANIPSGKSHWRHAHNEAKKWKQWVADAVLAAGGPPRTPLVRYRLALARFSSSEPDYDGLVRGFKVLIDGLREAGVLKDDKLSNTGPWACRWYRCKPKEGRMFVSVVEDEPVA